MARDRSRILIAGYYGFANAGDEAILHATLRELRRLRSNLDVVVISGNPNETQRRHAVRAVRFTDIAALVDAAAGCDLILLGGGGIFHDCFGFDPASVLTPEHGGLALFSGVAVLAALHEKPLMIVGAGVGPLGGADARAFTTFAFDESRVATVRDAGSRGEAIAAGADPRWIRVIPDPAFSIEAAHASEVRALLALLLPAGAEPLVGVALRNWTQCADSDWEQEVASALDAFLDVRAGHALLVPFQELHGDLVDDRAIAARLQSRMRHGARAVVVAGHAPAMKAALIGRCGVVLAMRLHSLIFAVRGGVPCVPLVYDAKVRNLARDVGLADLIVEIGGLTSAAVTRRLESALRRRATLRPSLLAAAAARSDAARDNAVLALDVLDGRIAARERRPESIRILTRATLSLSRAAAGYRAETTRWAAQAEGQAAHHAQAVGYLRDEVDALTRQVRSRDEGIDWLREQLRAHAEHVEVLSAQLRSRDEGIEWLQQQVRARDAIIDRLNSQLHERDGDAEADAAEPTGYSRVTG